MPPSAELIAYTEYPQIFKIHNSYALQFHPEVTKELFEDWYDSEVSRRELINHDVSSTLNHLIINEKTYKEEVNILYEKWISY